MSNKTSVPPYPVDLQVHSTCSDGTDTPQELVQKAAALGIQALALTDHDSVLGVQAAQEAGRTVGVYVLPAIEFSTVSDHERDFLDINILGYGLDPTDPTLQEVLSRVIDSRVEQKIRQVERLQAYGVDVPLEEVLALAGGVPGRPHIAQVALDHNPDKFTSMDDVFRQYLASDAEHSTYVPRRFALQVEEAIQVTHAAGGKAVLAHPGLYNRVQNLEAAVKRMVAAGLDGLEVYYPYSPGRVADPQQAVARFAEMAHRFDLFATGGSDYHGERKSTRLGQAGLEWRQWEQLREINGW